MNYQSALVQLPLVREAAGQRVSTPEDVYRICDDLAKLAQESFHVLTLTVKNKLLNRHWISLGLVDMSLVHSREIFRAAIQDSSSAILLVHNHPSGDVTPSAEDLRITRQLIEVGKLVDIKVLDHVIIGRPNDSDNSLPNLRGFLSMRESKLVEFV